jgi:DNA-binding response OmpR family regulator
MHILIVEKDGNVAYTLAQALRRALGEGFVIETCHFIAEAVALLMDHKSDLVITDLNTPGNLEFISQVQIDYPATRIIVMTGLASIQTEAQASSLADACLPKPFNPPDLLQLVRAVLSENQAGAAEQGT